MKKIVAIILALVAVICCSYALADLDAPLNVRWKEGSTATATWDAVEGADYYQVNIYVFQHDIQVGTSSNGTSDVELDVQNEVNSVILSLEEIFFFSFDVLLEFTFVTGVV